MLDYKKIGGFITDEREKFNLTQEQLAEKIYVTRQAVSKWERGLTLPNYTLLMSLCDLFKVTPNEILAGERIDNNNKEYINTITIEILKENSKKRKKMLIMCFSTTFIILFLFLVYYFLSTYSKLEVYLINGKSENFKLNDSLVVFSNETSYIKLGSVISDEFDYDYINIYYVLDNDKKNLLKTTHSDALMVQNNGYNELFNFKDKNIIFNDLYLDIHYKIEKEEKVDTIKLNVDKLYRNNNFLFKKDLTISKDESEEALPQEKSIPKKILNEFQVDDAGNYTKDYTKQKQRIKITYMSLANMLIVQEKEQNTIEEYILFEESKHIKYSIKEKDKEEFSEASFNENGIECYNEVCEKKRDKFEYFLNEYLSYYD